MKFDPGLTLFVITCITTVILIVGLAKTISDNRTRRRLAEARVDLETIQALFARDRQLETLRWLRWSLMLFAAGAAFLLNSALPSDTAFSTSFGLLLLFLGAGTFVYYRVATKSLPEKP
jgi:hypothetical protein